MTLQQAKSTLKNKGWSYRRAAPLLGVRQESLSRILNGQFQNRRVLRAIEHLPASPVKYQHVGFARRAS